MNSSERDARIIESLKIKPVTHGQIHTFQIAVPNSLAEQVAADKIELLKQSLREKGSNLIPLVVRRTDAYSEDEQFEVVYGADWVLAAREVDVEMLWAWLFELNDDETTSVREELKEILGNDKSSEATIQVTKAEFERLFERKIKPVQDLLQKVPKVSTQKTSESPSILERLSDLEQKITSLEPKIDRILELLDPPKPPKVNLSVADEHQMIRALTDKGLDERYASAAVNAVQFWKNSDLGLTWKNLKKSVKSGKYKIDDFGDKTFRTLQAIGEIS